jgi:hypothetical protein
MRVTAFWLTLVATCGLAQELVSTDDNDKINELDNSIHDPFEEYASSDDEEGMCPDVSRYDVSS